MEEIGLVTPTPGPVSYASQKVMWECKALEHQQVSYWSSFLEYPTLGTIGVQWVIYS